MRYGAVQPLSQQRAAKRQASTAPFSGLSVLHVGCGGDKLPDWMEGAIETRLDIDPIHRPDIIASMTDMGDIGTFDAVISMHSLEHVYPHEAEKTMCEFHRILKPGGFACVIVPDLEDIKATKDIVYQSPSGPVTGLDMFYGLNRVLEAMPYMAHKNGFVSETLESLMCGYFRRVIVRRIPMHNLMGVGITE